MEPSVRQGLTNNTYETRKRTALAFEPVLRELAAVRTSENDHKLSVIIAQLVELAGSRLNSTAATTAVRSGGIMGLASLAIALGPRLADYLGAIILPVLSCFEDHDSKLRYFALESMYNIAKVAQGELLIYFNELFDALSKLVCESEVSIKNGAELLDRLLKDIVTEQASTYVSLANYGSDDPSSPSFPSFHPGHEKSASTSSSHDTSSEPSIHEPPSEPQRAFSLPRFIPLLRERMTVLNPFTRTFLINWLVTLDSVPDLELISYLPDFLEGLLRYLGDPSGEVGVAMDGLLERFLGEIKDVREVEVQHVQARREAWEREVERRRRRASEAKTVTETDGDADEGDPRGRLEGDGEGTPVPRRDGVDGDEEDELGEDEDEDALDTSSEEYEDEYGGTGEWTPGQGVHIDYAAIVEILVRNLSFPDEEIQSTCLHWIAEFLQVVPGVLVSFSPRLIPVILSALAHHVPAIQQAAADTNDYLFSVIQSLPVDAPNTALSPTSTTELSPPQPSNASFPHHDRALTASPPPSAIPFPTSATSATPRPGHDRHKPGSDASSSLLHHQSSVSTLPSIASTATTSFAPPPHPHNSPTALYPHGHGQGYRYPPDLHDAHEPDGARFQYGATVNELTLQFLSENEETRVAALEWLLMLQQKAPRKILAGDDPSQPTPRARGAASLPVDAPSTRSRQRNPSASSTSSGLSIALLLKMLSDPSERVLRYDLQLLAQISATPAGGAGAGAARGEEDYFPGLMSSLLELFSTDRKLLETRGSLIIRQLCGSLNAERIYRTCAEILEKDEDLEFASIMVQNLNLIMITSPELSDFRKRLRTLDSKDGQNLFVTLYRSWSHNAVATFTLCLLAQAYEQACALLQIFADLEMTVSLLVQIDKLVQLLESPVFTSLRLQLLEPERHPYLLKAMYGLLMLLPQSSAFATLRNRLSAVSTLGFLGTVPRGSYASPTAVRPSSLVSPSTAGSGPIATLSSRRGDASAGGSGTPDPPSIRWTELLGHFRGVQKRRAAASSGATAGGAGGGAGADGAASGPRSLVSPRGSAAFANGQRLGGAGGGGGEGESVDGVSPPTGTSSTFSGAAGSRVVSRRKTNPSFQVQHAQQSSTSTAQGSTSASSSLAGGGRGFGGGALGGPGGLSRGGSGFTSTTGGAGSSAGASGGPRALSPTLSGAAGAKRRIGSAPQTGLGMGGGVGRRS
ncbi:hypothetical protein JCM10207_002894 [Rhodosporidiobolus poonsookiae]